MANMSHELRTPLNSVIGFSNILRKNTRLAFTPREIGYIERIQGNGRHLLTLINSVLDLSKVEAGHMKPEPSAVPLGAVVLETVAELESQALLGNRRIIVDMRERACVINTDRAKFKQILMNLLGNALKFGEDGDVRLVVRYDEISGDPMCIDIVDRGIGIAPDRIDSIFEAFQQADNSTSRQFGGTGLGLTISRSLGRLLGFDIEVASELGVGSTFRVVLGSSTTVDRALVPLLAGPHTV